MSKRRKALVRKGRGLVEVCLFIFFSTQKRYKICHFCALQFSAKNGIIYALVEEAATSVALFKIRREYVKDK